METFTVCICRQNNVTPKPDSIRDKTFNRADIKEFFAYNDSLLTKKGNFRRFMLQGTIRLHNGESWHIGTMDTTELKKTLKSFAKEVTKNHVVAYRELRRGHAERKAVNWTYTF
jgi:hypothetical protein